MKGVAGGTPHRGPSPARGEGGAVERARRLLAGVPEALAVARIGVVPAQARGRRLAGIGDGRAGGENAERRPGRDRAAGTPAIRGPRPAAVAAAIDAAVIAVGSGAIAIGSAAVDPAAVIDAATAITGTTDRFRRDGRRRREARRRSRRDGPSRPSRSGRRSGLRPGRRPRPSRSRRLAARSKRKARSPRTRFSPNSTEPWHSSLFAARAAIQSPRLWHKTAARRSPEGVIVNAAYRRSPLPATDAPARPPRPMAFE